MNHVWLVAKLSLTKKYRITFLKEKHAINCRRAVKHLNRCLHNNDKIWQIALTKIKEILSEEIKMIKNNSSELIKLNGGLNPDIILEPIGPEQFHEHYQELTSTREEQEQ
ncbi:hypothetical protein G9A89_013774 [Geosiphon pyriformis]|nr:hypothetical protein G9A89_013774 [Geosiphon pyriformis]